MSIRLVELTANEVIGLNRSAIEDHHRRNPGSQQQHVLRNRTGLEGCLGGVFFQLTGPGYVNLPLEKMAGLLLYRISESQYFLDGNKRTALLSSVRFLWNNGHRLRVIRSEVNNLLWGFAKSQDTNQSKYGEQDAIRFIFDNIFPNA